MAKPAIKSDGRFLLPPRAPEPRRDEHAGQEEEQTDPRPNGCEPQDAGQHSGSAGMARALRRSRVCPAAVPSIAGAAGK
jgi:hypothetical protein